MKEKLGDFLISLSSVLHFFGKYDACNDIIEVGKLLCENRVDTVGQLEAALTKAVLYEESDEIGNKI